MRNASRLRTGSRVALNGVLIVAVIVGGLVLRAHREQARTAATVGDVAGLASLCASAPRTDGFAVVKVSGPLAYRNSKATVQVPCKLDFRAGASLVMQNIELTTQSLVIMDSDQNGPTRVVLSRSTMRGGPDTGLYIDLLDASDSLVLEDTTVVSYPAEVTATVGTGASGLSGGQVVATNATVESLAPDSAGITLLAGSESGTAVFTNVPTRLRTA